MTKTTTPLAKAITTLEGQLVALSNVVLAVGAAIPSHVIPPKFAAVVAGALNVALIVQRLVLKAQASKIQATALSALSGQQPLEEVLSELGVELVPPGPLDVPPATATKANPDASEGLVGG